jgi:hypothetical protein
MSRASWLALAAVLVAIALVASCIELRRRSAPGESDAFVWLERAARAFDWPEERAGELHRLATGEEFDPALAAEILERNVEALWNLDAADATERFTLPAAHLAPPGTPEGTAAFEALARWHSLAELRAVGARFLFSIGEERGGFAEALRVVRLGHRLATARGTLFHHLLGLRICLLGLDRIADGVAASELSTVELRALAAELARLRVPVGAAAAGGDPASEAIERLVNVRVESVRVLAALRAYRDSEGALPDSLAALVPDYLTGVPTDDFGGGALRYSRERKRLWSIGDDGVDAGGMPDLRSELHEPVLVIDF